MRRIICVIMVFVMALNVNVVFAKTDTTKDKSIELIGKYDLSMDLSKIADKELISAQIQKNDDIINEKTIEKSNLKIGINEKDQISVLSGKLSINDKTFILKGEGSTKTYDVMGKNDYIFGEYFGYMYDNNKAVREFGLCIEYSKEENSYAASTISIIPMSVNEEIGSLVVLNFGDTNKDTNNKFYEKYKVNQNKDGFSETNEALNEDVVTVRTEETIPLTVKSPYKSAYGDLMYMAGFNVSTLKAGNVTKLHMRTWTKKANLEKYLQSKVGKPVVSGTAVITEANFKISNSANLRVFDYTPETGSTSFNIIVPYILGGSPGWQSLNITTSTTTATRTVASGSSDYNIIEWKLKKMSFFNNTDAQSSTPWFSSSNCGMGVNTLVVYPGKVTANTSKPIKWNGSYRYGATFNNLGVRYQVYDTISLTATSPMIITP